MKLRLLLATGCIPLIFCLSACSVLKKPVQLMDKFIDTTLFPPYSGPKASLAVADFDIKAAKATTEAAAGLRDMLIAGLNNTNRFEIIPPRKDDTYKSAGLIIAAEVIDFEPRASGGSEGIGGGGSAASGTLGSLLGVSANKSSVALNIRIVDAFSSKVLFSGRISGQALDTGGPGNRQRYAEESTLSASLYAYIYTPMEDAINKCIAEAVKYITQKVPDSYYKTDFVNQPFIKGEGDGKA